MASRGAISGWLGRWRSAAADLLFPPTCNYCGDDVAESDGGAIVCRACVQRMRPQAEQICLKCGMPGPALPASDGACPRCRGMKFAFSAVRTLGLYEGDLRQAVLRMKHHHYESLALALARPLAGVLRERPLPGKVDLVAPVPMHWLKRLWRGANSAETLAAGVAAELQLPVFADLVRCRRLLEKQGTLPAGRRFQNVRNAFRVRPSFDIRGAAVLLVDDVLTTGASADAVGKALRRAGAAEVFVLAAARGTGLP
jgi:ComF family protein